ncbi:MAG: TolC family protein, partial [Bacteroidaceae bacterium]|nr:TolC family protein [Bacteroidaceae bacterium]
MTPIFRSLLGLLLFALVTPTLRAQLTLEACYQLAEQHYPLVRQTDLLRQTEALTLDNIARAWRPQVVASAQATVQSDVAQWPENLTAMMQGVGMTAPQGIARDQYKFAVQIDQLLYDGGATRQQKAVAQAETAVAQSGVAVELYALRQRVAQLFFGLLLIDQQLDNHRVLQSVLADNHRKALAQQRGGVAPGQVVTLLEAEQITAQQGELALQSQRRALQRLLATFLGRDTAALGTLVCPPERSLALDENHRPELRQFDARAALLHQRETQLATALRPRISAFAQGWYGYPGLNLFHDMQSRAWSLNGIVGVRAVWDLS